MTKDIELGAVADFRSALRRFLRASEAATRSQGLTPARYDLLVMVTAAGREGATISTLAERLSLAANSVTELVDRCEASGLVRRRPDPQDARAIRVLPTGKGRARVAAAVARLAPERRQLLGLLADVSERLR